MKDLFSLSFLSLCGFLDPFQFDPLLFFHMFLIFLEMKANWSSLSEPSSLDSSSWGVSMLTALDELLDADLDEDSLQVEDIVAFCVVRVDDFPFLNPSSCWSSCSWTFKFQWALQWTWSPGSSQFSKLSPMVSTFWINFLEFCQYYHSYQKFCWDSIIRLK